jgi:hypothetical protein
VVEQTRVGMLVGCLVLFTACGTRQVPPPSAPVARLTTDDLAVMRAVLDGFVQRKIPLPANASLVVFGLTMPVCPTFASTSLALPDCVDRSWLAYLAPLMGTASGAAATIFEKANATSIARPYRRAGDHVIYSPSNVDRAQQLLAFADQYAPVAVGEFSLPAYVRRGAAVIAYRYFHNGLGFVLLHGSGDEWKVANVSGSTE